MHKLLQMKWVLDMLTSEVELALFDCVEVRRRLSEQLWCQLHDTKNSKLGLLQAAADTSIKVRPKFKLRSLLSTVPQL